MFYGPRPWMKVVKVASSFGRTEEATPIAQLYDMEHDPEETTNLYASRPKVAARLLTLLESDVDRGRSTAGPTVSNDVDEIVLWKSGM